MSRFITVNHTSLINVDHIVRVERHKNGNAVIHLIGGKIVNCDQLFEAVSVMVSGGDHIVSIIPAKEGSYAGYLRKDCPYIPVHYLAVTASGYVRPFGLLYDMHEFLDESDHYCGVWQSDELDELKKRAELASGDF